MSSIVETPSQPTKPAMRGLLHLIAFPVALVAGIVLTIAARTEQGHVACAIYTFGVSELFGISAAYHRGKWSPSTWMALKRWDHANIYVAIAGSYTPICVLVLSGTTRVALLSVVWAGTLAGIGLSVFWPAAPRPVLVPTYLVVGWSALIIIPQMLRRGGVWFLVLVLAGGVLYTCGGLVYALRRPDPWPATFGFHEVFHSFTVAAYLLQYAAISIIAYKL